LSRSRSRKPKYIQAPTTEDLERIESGEKFSDIKAGPIKKAIDNALDEDINEIEEIAAEPEAKRPSKRKNSFKRNMYFSLGVFVSIMSVIGIVFSVNFCVNTVKRIADNTDQKDKFSRMLFPVVVVDPPTFSEGEKLPVEIMLTAAVWDIIINEDKSVYNNEYGYITVPASDVEVHATKLFGTELSFAHQTLGDPEMYFVYDESINSYLIPVSPHYLPYTPTVESITKISDKKYELKIGCNSLVKSWLPESSGEPEKIMKYTLIKNGNNYNIVAIDNVIHTDVPMS